MKRIILALALVAGTTVLAAPATATPTTEMPCTATVEDQAAYDETVVVTPAYDETVVDQAAQPAVAGQWWNFSPNKVKGPFKGTPAFPADRRGTWQGPHTEGGPSQDLTGTFQQGNGNGSWFHRDPGTPAVAEVSHVVTHPAVTELVHHEATTKVVEVPCEEPPVEVVAFPLPESSDPCGLDNASWVKPADTDAVHWSIGDAGQLTGETQAGYTWPNGTTINGWGQAPESGTSCPVPPVDPPAEPPVEPPVIVDPPVVVEPPAEPPVTDTPPIAQEAPPVAVSITTTPTSAKVEDEGVLPNTGGPNKAIGFSGLAALLAGLALIATRRRKTA